MSVVLSLLEIILWLFLMAVALEILMIVCWFALSIFFVCKDGWKDIKEDWNERKHRT